MPFLEAQVECPVHDSFRVRQVAGMFDLSLAKTSRETFRAEVPDLNEPWTIGVVVGPSGSGKTSVARQAFPSALSELASWPADEAVVDGFPEGSIRDVTKALTAVGFSSPPAWLRPYRVLSGGERFRADLARALIQDENLCVFDEFTSVVDRTVAKVGSLAVSKAVRRGGVAKRFVAVTCHYDVVEWLEPDWVLDMATGQLARGRLRRPKIDLKIVRCHHSAWNLFRRHHYLSSTMSTACECYLALWNDEPVAFCALMAMAGRKGRWRISRLVVLPDYQGIGIGTKFGERMANHFARRNRGVNLTTSHPAMIEALRRSAAWRAVCVKKTGFGIQNGHRSGRIPYYAPCVSQGRPVVTFQFVASQRGAALPEGTIP